MHQLNYRILRIVYLYQDMIFYVSIYVKKIDYKIVVKINLLKNTVEFNFQGSFWL